LTDVRRGMPAYEEELFGPVAAIISVKDEEEAITTANDSAFGLGGGVITRDLARGERIAAERIESGCVFVNEAVRSDSRLPFGGKRLRKGAFRLRHQRVCEHKDSLCSVVLALLQTVSEG
jgi:acyl-CoA reductase-like NAD-dependent aldehyde dehydrogenase